MVLEFCAVDGFGLLVPLGSEQGRAKPVAGSEGQGFWLVVGEAILPLDRASKGHERSFKIARVEVECAFQDTADHAQ